MCSQWPQNVPRGEFPPWHQDTYFHPSGSFLTQLEPAAESTIWQGIKGTLGLVVYFPLISIQKIIGLIYASYFNDWVPFVCNRGVYHVEPQCRL